MSDCKTGQSIKMRQEIQTIKKQEITFRKYYVSVHPQNCIFSASFFTFEKTKTVFYKLYILKQSNQRQRAAQHTIKVAIEFYSKTRCSCL